MFFVDQPKQRLSQSTNTPPRRGGQVQSSFVGGVPRRLSICQNEGFFKWHFEELQSFTVSCIPPWIYPRSPETLLSIDARLGSRHNRGHTGSSGMRRRICTRLMVRLQSLRVFIYTTYSRNTYQLAHATQYIDLRTLPDTGSSAHKTKKLRKMYHDALIG